MRQAQYSKSEWRADPGKPSPQRKGGEYVVKNMRNTLYIQCDDIDLTKVTYIEFYLRQGTFFRQYEPEIVSEHAMLIEIPLDDAMKLVNSTVRLQFAFTDEGENSRASEVTELSVRELLKEAGYDPV